MDKALHRQRYTDKKDGSPAARLLRMIRTLCARGMTRAELEEEFQVSRRHIYDYLRDIENLGYVFEESQADRERVWKIDGSFHGVKPEPATATELMALYIAKAHLAYLNGTPFQYDYDSVLRKIEAGLPAKTANKIEQAVRVFLPVQRPQRSYANQSHIITELQKGLLLQRTILLKHRSGGYRKHVTHAVDPYGLQLFEQGLYLVGYSHRAKDLRRFAVERIQSACVDMSADPFVREAQYQRKALSHTSFGLIDDETMEVEVEFNREVAYYFKERQWHPSQRIKSLRNGNIRVSIQASGIDEMAFWVLSWGASAKVIAPPKLASLVRKHLAGMTLSYSASPANPPAASQS